MAVIHGYCTVEQVRTELKDDDDRLDEALLEKAINAASRAVDKWTGRRFWLDEEPTARRLRPATCTCTEVPDFASLDGLIVETDDAGTGTWTAWTIDDDFEVEPEDADADGPAYAWWELIAIDGKRFKPARRKTLRVTAQWGWSQVPVEVEEATILRAVALFRRKEAPFGVAGFGEFGAVRITRRDADVIDLLTPFQKVMAA